MSMWGGSKKDQTNGDGLTEEPPLPIVQDDGASRNSRRSYEPSRRSHEPREEPTERTRLLDRPRPPNSDGYLDPDDPAVRPIKFHQELQYVNER
jgi:hypothetical protein